MHFLCCRETSFLYFVYSRSETLPPSAAEGESISGAGSVQTSELSPLLFSEDVGIIGLAEALAPFSGSDVGCGEFCSMFSIWSVLLLFFCIYAVTTRICFVFVSGTASTT